MESRSLIDSPGLIGKYQVLNEIGQGTKTAEHINLILSGNWGKVKLGLDTETGEQVAIKILYRQRIERKMKNGLDRLKGEFSLVQSLNHPNIIKYHQMLEDEYHLYIIMDLGGESLDVIKETDPIRLTPIFIQGIIRKLIEAVLYLSEQSVAHHDIKPANILIDNEEHVLLCDFGVAELYDRTVGCHSFFGTPTFQAPEIASNVSGQTFDGTKSDMWAIGVVLHYALTGAYPYQAETVYMLLRTIEEEPVSFPPDLHPSLYDLLSSKYAYICIL